METSLNKIKKQLHENFKITFLKTKTTSDHVCEKGGREGEVGSVTEF